MRKYIFFLLSLVAMPLAAQLETTLEPVEAPFETGKIALPLIPQRQAEVKMNKKGLSTQAIQKAIDHMSEKGGGTVVIPEGTWTTGRIKLKSNVNLRIPEGAELRFSGEVKDYQPAVYRVLPRKWSWIGKMKSIPLFQKNTGTFQQTVL